MTQDTTLQLKKSDGSFVAFPPGSARGIKCDVAQVGGGELRRTINGKLVDMTRSALRKLTISLSADGVAVPDLRSLWQGQEVTVSPPVAWTAVIRTGETVASLERPAESWSIKSVSWQAVTGATLSADRKTLTLDAPATSDLVISYQPTLECLVTSVSLSADEWEASATWSLELEEV